jgi:MFS transporter, DHA3 family, macrolide efflux protein
MPTFFLIWFGQLVSTIGSYMTVFALTIWVWQLTGSTTALALVGFFSQLPRLIVTSFAGIAVDRFNRKFLMLLGEVAALLCTLAIATLFLTKQLQVWHLYCAVIVYGGFGQLQLLAYSTSIALLVPKEQYTRAESMGSAVGYSAAIFAPALSGNLYPTIGLPGIFAIDLVTFAASLVTLLIARIPQPQPSESQSSENLWQNLTFGFRYIWSKPSLTAMVIAFSLFAIPSDLSKVLFSPMILARTGGDAQILGNVTTAAGVGGVLGAVLLSVWGGFDRRIYGMLFGFVGHGFFKVILGFVQTPILWMGSSFLASLHIPLFYSSSNAIWYSKVPPHLQGRVLGADQTIGVIVSSVTPLLGGVLADRVFEPAMRSNGQFSAIFAPIFGTGAGAGIALLYTMMSILIVLVGVGGYFVRSLREVESLLPDHSSTESR